MKRDDDAIKNWLEERKSAHLYRTAKISESPQQPRMVIDGKEVLSFCSNDYLGLANHPLIIKALKKATNSYGVGSGASHLVNGHSIEHHLLEEELAEFTGRDSALLFSTGYMANIGVVNALMERGDAIFQDRLNHASLIDAGLLSGARVTRYAHNDMDALAGKLSRQGVANTLILSDGVFSMDGDVADLAGLIRLSEQHKTWLMVDDAHGFGVLGNNGVGLVEVASANQNQVPLLMATLGKAAGVSGAFVAGKADYIEYIRQTARTWIYTTAMPAALAAALRESLKLIQNESWRRDKLQYLIGLLRAGSLERGIELMPSETAIQPVVVGGSRLALKLSDYLFNKNILVTAIRPPTVPKDTSRLRITLSANHDEQDISILLDELERGIRLIRD